MHSERRESGRRSRGSPRLYWLLERTSEVLIYAILIFTPWAFGTTERWAIETVNTLNYFLGGLLVTKWILRRATGFVPERWGNQDGPAKWITFGLGLATVAMLTICAVAGLNARAEYIWDENRFQYFEGHRSWLPHSYDRASTWRAFQMYLAAACFFWALRDWIRTKDRSELHRTEMIDRVSDNLTFRVPARLKRLLWVLCINGALLSLEGALQRLSGTNELLWSVKPRFNVLARAQFGPFNYRSNGAQYLNMLWPIAFGFWWALHHRAKQRIGGGPEFLLLPIAAIMLAGPVISLSRGGVAIALLQSIAVIAVFAYAFRRAARWKIAAVVLLFGALMFSAAMLQWSAITVRLNENSFNTMSGRTEIYANSEKIVEDYPVWGTGPGTFATVYQLYRENPDQIWFATAHNDFLQTRITFGAVGLAIAMLMVVLVLAYWWVGGGITAPMSFVSFFWVALGGCLIHARFDFPLQIYSLLLLFLAICAALSTLGKK